MSEEQEAFWWVFKGMSKTNEKIIFNFERISEAVAEEYPLAFRATLEEAQRLAEELTNLLNGTKK